jgi:hypothetical protein
LVSKFYLPQKPYSVVDAINRAAAATGSMGMAMAGHDADYNGHYNHLCWNDYRGYYVGEYTWAGRNVWYRGVNFAQALDAACREYDRQGRGATMHVCPQGEKDAALAAAHPRFREGEEGPKEWAQDWRFAKVGDALRNEKMFGISCVPALVNAASEEEYQAHVDAGFARFREAMDRNREQALAAQRQREQEAFPGLEEGLDTTVVVGGFSMTPARIEQLRRQFEGE